MNGWMAQERRSVRADVENRRPPLPQQTEVRLQPRCTAWFATSPQPSKRIPQETSQMRERMPHCLQHQLTQPAAHG